MNTLEDTLRAALDETGAEITPQSVPPLRLHDGWRRPGRTGAGLGCEHVQAWGRS